MHVLSSVFQGQTPFDVADESLKTLMEELSQKQAHVSHLNTLLCRDFY